MLLPGALRNCGDVVWVLKGLLIDNGARSPLSTTMMSQAAQVLPCTHYDGWYAADRQKLVPLIQETYGRMGKAGVMLFKR